MSVDRAAAERDLAKLEMILSWAQRFRDLDKSPRWKTDLEGVFEEHATAADAVWSGLFELVDIRATRGEPVVRFKPPEDMKKQIKTLLVRELRKTLPTILQDAVETTIEGLEL